MDRPAGRIGRRQPKKEADVDRPRIGARALALVATLVVLIAASILADRLGVPWRITFASLTGLCLTALGFAAVTSRTLRLSTFRLAGRRLGWSRGGGMMLALALGLMLLTGEPLGAAPQALAAMAGTLAYGLLYAGPLRAAGAASLGGFALARYRSRGLSALVGLAVLAICAGLALRAAPQAVAAFAAIPVMTDDAARFAFLALLLAMILPGGIASLAAAGVVAILLACAAFGLPAVAVLTGAEAAASEALSRLAPALAQPMLMETLGLAAVIASVLAIGGPGAAMRSAGLARQVSGGAALAVLVVAGLAMVLTFSAEHVTRSLGGVPPERLPGLLYAERVRGLITVCGIAPEDPATVAQACRPLLQGGNVPAGEIRVVSETPERWMIAALDLPASFAALGLITPAVLLTMLVAALLRIAAASLIDDLIYRLLPASGSASGRLALHRLAMIGGGATLTFALVPPLPGAALHGLAMAAALLPALVVLPGLSRRANARAIAPALLATPVLIALPLFDVRVAAFSGWGLVAAVAGLTALMLILLPSREAADAHAAAVLTGQATAPLVEADA
jgi:hypothetical protein